MQYLPKSGLDFGPPANQADALQTMLPEMVPGHWKSFSAHSSPQGDIERACSCGITQYRLHTSNMDLQAVGGRRRRIHCHVDKIMSIGTWSWFVREVMKYNSCNQKQLIVTVYALTDSKGTESESILWGHGSISDQTISSMNGAKNDYPNTWCLY